MNFHIILDTNVLVSALISKKPDAATVVLLSRVINDNRITLLLNNDIVAEYTEVLFRPKFNLSELEINHILFKLKSICKIVEAKEYEGNLPDSKDVMFIEVSLSTPGSIIITGNIKHFPNIKNVLSPAQFLALLDAKE